MQSAPTISVVIPNYNHGYCLPRALDSICTQEVPPDDILILDDRSTDNSMDVIREYAQRYPYLRFEQYPQKSEDCVKAWLRNVHRLKGDYVLGLASDDKIYPGFFKRMKELAAAHPGVGTIFSQVHHIGPNDSIIYTNTYGISDLRYFTGAEAGVHFARPGGIGPSGVASVMRRDAFEWLIKHGFDEIGQWGEFGWGIGAIMHGMVMVPEAYGAYTDFGPSYHVNNMYHPTRCLDWFQRLRKFLRQPSFQGLIPQPVIDEWERLAFATFPAQAKYLVHGQNLAQAGQVGEANNIFQQLTAQCPDYSPAWEQFAITCLQLRDPVRAEQAFQRVVELNPNSPNFHNNLGVCRLVQGKLNEAAQAFSRAIELHPGFGEAYQNMGDVFASAQRLHEARDMYIRAVQANPNLVEATRRLEQLKAMPQMASGT